MSDSTIEFITYAMIIAVVVMIFAIPAGIKKGKKENERIYGDNNLGTEQKESEVRVITCKSTPHPLNQTIMVNSVLFELKNGSRLELAIKDQNQFGVIAMGDVGELRYSGKKFISFKRYL